MSVYSVEITDTFGGEANYSWVRRYSIEAVSMRGAVAAMARREGSGWVADYNDGDGARYNARGQCVCAFIRFEDDTHEWEVQRFDPASKGFDMVETTDRRAKAHKALREYQENDRAGAYRVRRVLTEAAKKARAK